MNKSIDWGDIFDSRKQKRFLYHLSKTVSSNSLMLLPGHLVTCFKFGHTNSEQDPQYVQAQFERINRLSQPQEKDLSWKNIPLSFHFRSQNFYLPFLEAPNQKSLSGHIRNFLLPFSFHSKHGDRGKPWRSDKDTHNQVK